MPGVIEQLEIPSVDLTKFIDLTKQGLFGCYLPSIDKAEDYGEGLIDFLSVPWKQAVQACVFGYFGRDGVRITDKKRRGIDNEEIRDEWTVYDGGDVVAVRLDSLEVVEIRQSFYDEAHVADEAEAFELV